uniref:Uncharacterized protein n=1 Tax=Tetranychus urticae TaxID=32264 RepID=T1L2X0_TETUR
MFGFFRFSCVIVLKSMIKWRRY